MTTLPAELTFGYVVGRFLLAVGDSDDAGPEPDARAGVGFIRFDPRPTNRRIESPSVSEWSTVAVRPPLCSLDENGYLIARPEQPGVWLPVGTYDVTFLLKDMRILPITITVTEEHTLTDPLDLSVAIPVDGDEPLGNSQYEELSLRIAAHLNGHGTGGGGGGFTEQEIRDILFAALDMGSGIDIHSYDPSSITIRQWHGWRATWLSYIWYWTGDHVYHEGKIYTALQTSTQPTANSPEPGTDPTWWQELPITASGGAIDRETLIQALDPLNPGLSGILVPGDDINIYRMAAPNEEYIMFQVMGLGAIRDDIEDLQTAVGGAPTWDSITGKPATFAPSTHTHDDRYYTESEIDTMLGSAGAVQTVDNKTASYTLVAGDLGKLITMSSTSAMNLSIPTDASMTWPIGGRVDIAVINTGMVTAVAVTPGTTAVNGTPSLISRARYSVFSCEKIAANSWLIVGDLA